ncbi:protease inhibitor I9 family protein [Paenibacillus guangzhouensis]|uniref:protease inhibitor I9 family protein n=1 Tax=Paenibacillus guangzhouensis TaxID=1473112 RepID=UPI001266D544|nr:protease inhibitor I9 family protein [Paenibacillus guangzhouensis]
MKLLNRKKIAITLAATIAIGGIISSVDMNTLVFAEKKSSDEVSIQPMHISNELYAKLKNAKVSDKFSCIVTFNSHVDEKEYAALEKNIGKINKELTYSKGMEGFSAKLTKKEIELLNNNSNVSKIKLVSEFLVGKELTIASKLNGNTDGWIGGFADYPEQDKSIYQLNYSHKPMPKELNNKNKALFLSGVNRSDDLFMFVKKNLLKGSKLKPNTTYSVTFDFEIATNASSGLIGVGGSPGESVYVKAGVTTQEPKPQLNKEGFYLMNIDKGDQSEDGKNSLLLGNLAKLKSDDDSYELKTFTNKNNPFIIKTNAKGDLWIFIGTDSGYESKTSIYIPKINVKIREIKM